MNELWSGAVRRVVESPFLRGAVSAGVLLLILLLILLVLLGITILLRMFFRRHPLVDRAHRVLAYLVTMAGVVVLLIGGILGMVLPIIPGIVLIIFALVLLRKYHKNKWLDSKIRYLQIRMHIRRSVRKLKARIRKHRLERRRRRASRRASP